MTTYAEIRSALWSWADGNTPNECTVVFANQDGSRPALPFVTLMVNVMDNSDWPRQSSVSNEGIITITQDRDITASINAFGPNAWDIADGLRRSLDKITVGWDLARDDLIYVQPLTGINDLSAVVGSGYEQRAQMDIMFRAAAVDTDDVGLIENVEGSGDLGDNVPGVVIDVQTTIEP